MVAGEDREQIAQEVLIKVWKGLSGFSPRGKQGFTRWVNTLTRLERRTVLAEKGRELARRVYYEDDPNSFDEDGLSSSEKLENAASMRALRIRQSSPAGFAESADVAESLVSSKDKFLRRYAQGVLDGKKASEIAAELGISYGALRERLRYRRNKKKVVKDGNKS